MQIAQSLDEALARSRHVLFTHFDLTKWFCLGVMIFLDVLFRGSFFALLNFSPWDVSNGYRELYENLEDFLPVVQDRLSAFAGLGIVLLFAYSLWMVLTCWLSSRGQLMLVRAVARNDGRIGVNWSHTSTAANSLFLFRLFVKVIMLLATIGASIVFVLLVAREDTRAAGAMVYFLALASIFLMWFTVVATAWTVETMLRDFVVPIMYHNESACLEAWRTLGRCIRGNIIPFHLFYLVRFVISLVSGVAGIFVALFTCCLGALPVISQTFLAPLYVFDRAFSMYALQSMLPELEIIESSETFPDDPFGERFSRDLVD